MTVVDRPDNGQDEGRDGYVKVGQYWVPIEPLQLHYPLGRGCCGAPDSDTCHQRGLCWMEGVHPDSPGYPQRPWRPEDGDSRCQQCGRLNPVWFAPDRLWNHVVGGDPNREAHGVLCPSCFATKADELLALLGGPQPDDGPDPCRVYSDGADGWHCAVEGLHEEHRNAAGDVTWSGEPA